MDAAEIEKIASENYSESLHFHMSHTIQGCVDYIKDNCPLPHGVKSVSINVTYGPKIQGSQIRYRKNGVFFLYLNDKAKDTYINGVYDKDLVESVRGLLLHELGHAVLHTEMLVGVRSWCQDDEDEADFFSSEMNRKRKEVIKEYYRNGLEQIL